MTDYPDVPYRGVVEGFYGAPWSQEARIRQLDFYGRNLSLINIFLYAVIGGQYVCFVLVGMFFDDLQRLCTEDVYKRQC